MSIPFLLQSMHVVPDGNGGSVQQWSTLAALWGSLGEHGDGMKQANFAQPTHVIQTRRRLDVEITTAHRLAYNGRYFQIRAVTSPDEHKRYLKLLVTEVTYLN